MRARAGGEECSLPESARERSPAAPPHEVAGRGDLRPADGRRRRDIQGLRALAVILVVLFHAGLPAPGGFVGVDIFFVISGFVITAMLLRELECTGGLDFVSFYSRRARRILPALSAMVVVVALASSLLLSPSSQQRTAALGIAASLFTANGALYKTSFAYFDPGVSTFPLLHTWSLAVEEQFYIFFPAFLFLAWRVGRRAAKRSLRSVVAAMLILLGVTSFALSLWTTRADSQFAFYSSPTRAWEFAVGGLLALGASRLADIGGRAASALGAMGVLAIAIATSSIHPVTPFPGTVVLLPVMGAAMLIAAGSATTKGPLRVLTSTPAVWIGDLSYGWYLWHWPAIVFARILWPAGPTWLVLMVGVAALLPAWLSTRWLEKPIRLDATRIGRRVLPLIAKSILVPILACGMLLFVGGVYRSTGRVKDLAWQGRLHADHARGCDLGRPFGSTGPACSWQSPNASGSIVLLGDSNAGQYSEPAALAADRSKLDLTVATANGCPFVDLVVSYGPPFNSQECRRFVLDSVAAVVRSKPNLVILASSSVEYVNGSSSMRDPRGGDDTSDPARKALLWEIGLASVLHQLSSAGVPTVVIHTMPHIKAFDLSTCPVIQMLTNARRCGRSESRREIEEQQRLTLTAEKGALAGIPHSSGVDFTDALCASECATNKGDEWVYRDSNHLTVRGALGLTDRFVDIVTRNARPDAHML